MCPALPSFASWLQSRILELPPTVESWDVALANELDLPIIAAEYDRHLRRVHSGRTRRPRPELAFAIGEALRVIGIPWCSGPLAIHATQDAATFYALVVEIAKEAPRAATRLAFGAHAAAATSISSDRTTARHHALLAVREAAPIWKTAWPRVLGRSRLPDAPALLLLARDVASSKRDVDFATRELLAQTSIAHWMTSDGDDATRNVLHELASLPQAVPPFSFRS